MLGKAACQPLRSLNFADWLACVPHPRAFWAQRRHFERPGSRRFPEIFREEFDSCRKVEKFERCRSLVEVPAGPVSAAMLAPAGLKVPGPGDGRSSPAFTSGSPSFRASGISGKRPAPRAISRPPNFRPSGHHVRDVQRGSRTSSSSPRSFPEVSSVPMPIMSTGPVSTRSC
jgi:hypothetical protein